MRRGTISLLASVLLILAGSPAWADTTAPVLFDNGTVGGTQEYRTNSPPHTVWEDFELSSASTVDGLWWAQHDGTGGAGQGWYRGTLLTFFGDVSPSRATLFDSDSHEFAGTPLYQTTVFATRTLNSTPAGPSNTVGYDYLVSGLNLQLAAGTYYVGIQTLVSAGGTNWDQTTGTSDTLAGRWQTMPGGTGRFVATEDSAFQVLGPAPIPLPPAGWAGLALLGGLAVLRRVRRRRAA